MNITFAIASTYGLLVASIIAAWLKPWRISKSLILPPWVPVSTAACLSGLATGLVAWTGALALAAFALLACTAKARKPGWIKAGLLIGTGWMTLAFAMHQFPGFANPALLSNIRVSVAAPLVTQRLNFDTAAAGLILLGIFCVPARSRAEWRKVWQHYPVMLATPAVVLLTGLGVGYVKFDPKFPAYAPLFFACNLLFTCITEEAFFRGFIQQQLTDGMRPWRAGPWIALCAAALLFGIAHAKGGPVLMGLAALAGLGYGYAYLRSKRIEAAILTHFALNALHFVAFTYPRVL